MRVLHVVAGLPREGGGLSELVPAFAREAARQGHKVVLATVAGAADELSDKAREAESAGVTIVRFKPAFPMRLYFSAELWRGLRRLVEQAELVHVHANWTFPVWRACHLALALKRPLVMSPQGCLEPVRLARSAWKKRLAGMLFDRRYLRRATVIHATCAAEAEGIRAYLGRPTGGAPIAVVPNGVDLEAFREAAPGEAFDAKWPACRGKRVLLSLSRLDPIKGLDLLVSAWGRLAGSYPEWHLVIAGPDAGGFEGRLKQAAAVAGLSSRVTFCGPLYGSDKGAALRRASLFVLPTRNDNFGIAVAEALACGVPAVATKGAPWAELLGNAGSSEVQKCKSSKERELVTANGANQANADSFRTLELPNSRTSRCGWWVEIGEEPLAEALCEAMSLTDEERQKMGENGRRLVERKYGWETVAEKMAEVYSIP